MTRFLRFCMVGAVGFVVDGGILLLLTQGLGLGPLRSRAISFSAAVITTWVINRIWAFRDRPQASISRELFAYISMQVFGLAINFSLYTYLVLYAEVPFNHPLIALCIATGVSLLFNFATLVKFVFPHKDGPALSKSGQYSGTDNLETMSDARNYNGYLASLIFAQADRHMSIVDYGAGIGTFARTCAEHGLSIRCVEPDIEQSKIIKASGISVSPTLTEIPNESVDLLYTLNVLEHIEDDQAALLDIYTKLKPGGRLLIYVPAFQILYSSMDRKVGHYRRYTRAELIRKTTNTGFVVLRNRYIDSLGFAASLLYKMVGSDSGTIGRRSILIYDRLIFPVSRVLDRLFSGLLGKNVYLLAQKPTGRE